MNTLKEKIGIISSVIIITGCLLKAFHLQGAAVVLTSGFFFFSLIFMPSIIFSQLKEKKIIHAIASFFLITLTLGVLFKIMHWPFANFLISWSVTISLFGITPIYIIKNYSNHKIEFCWNWRRDLGCSTFSMFYYCLLMVVLIHDFNEQFEIHLLQNRSLQLPNFLLYSVILQLKTKGRVAKSITG